MAIRTTIRVELDDGHALDVVADQRDFAAAEGADIGSSLPNTWVRYCAWSALTRTKKYTGSWEQFNTVDCVEASDAPEEQPTPDDGLDPGRKGRSGGS